MRICLPRFLVLAALLLGGCFWETPESDPDYLMLDGFENFLPADLVVSMELLSRSLSFYICVLLCGVFVFFMSARKRKGALH